MSSSLLLEMFQSDRSFTKSICILFVFLTMTVLECIFFLFRKTLESLGSDALEPFYLWGFYISPDASSLHSGVWNFQTRHLFDRHYMIWFPYPWFGDDLHLHQYHYFSIIFEYNWFKISFLSFYLFVTPFVFLNDFGFFILSLYLSPSFEAFFGFCKPSIYLLLRYFQTQHQPQTLHHPKPPTTSSKPQTSF